VTRHANVKIARVVTRSDEGYLTVNVTDHGVGFAPSGKSAGSSPGLGLAAMRERIAHIGGTFVIKSARNRGTTATIHVPMSPP
jgi:signal transduction histidine kinase